MAERTEYHDKVQAWLDTPEEERNIEVGATLMLQGNRNRILHQNVLRKNNHEKVVYELRKIMGPFLVVADTDSENKEETGDEPTCDENLKIEKLQALDANRKPEGSGKRDDHDTLPEEIQDIYEKNLQIYPVMRSLHEKLKVLSEEGHTAEERLPVLDELIGLSDELTANWERYDSFDINNPGDAPKVPVWDVKRAQANRTFISRSKNALEKLIKKDDEKAVAEYLVKVQEKYDESIANGLTFDAVKIEELAKLGLVVKEAPAGE